MNVVTEDFTDRIAKDKPKIVIGLFWDAQFKYGIGDQPPDTWYDETWTWTGTWP